MASSSHLYPAVFQCPPGCHQPQRTCSGSALNQENESSKAKAAVKGRDRQLDVFSTGNGGAISKRLIFKPGLDARIVAQSLVAHPASALRGVPFGAVEVSASNGRVITLGCVVKPTWHNEQWVLVPSLARAFKAFGSHNRAIHTHPG